MASKKNDLLFTNLSGEDFDALGKSTEACKKFTMARRADHFVLFLDSDLLSDLESRQTIRTNSINVLMGLLDANMITSKARIDVVFSRWDRLLGKTEIEKHKKFIEQIKEDISKRVKPFNHELNFLEIASRPDKDGLLGFGHGLKRLFENWMNSKDVVEIDQLKIRPSTSPSREFSKYTTDTSL
jgi:hypothetical protein